MKILVLCHGNKYRSPACEGFLRQLGCKDIESAGFAYPDQPAAKKMREALVAFGIDVSTHTSRVVTQQMVDRADIILYMDGGNRKRLAAAFPGAMRKAKCLADYIRESRIPDPAFIRPQGPTFTQIVDKIKRASNAVYDKIILEETTNGQK